MCQCVGMRARGLHCTRREARSKDERKGCRPTATERRKGKPACSSHTTFCLAFASTCQLNAFLFIYFFLFWYPADKFGPSVRRASLPFCFWLCFWSLSTNPIILTSHPSLFPSSLLPSLPLLYIHQPIVGFLALFLSLLISLSLTSKYFSVS